MAELGKIFVLLFGFYSMDSLCERNRQGASSRSNVFLFLPSLKPQTCTFVEFFLGKFSFASFAQIEFE